MQIGENKKYLLVLASYNDYRQKHFEMLHSPRNQKYCDYHGFEYIEVKDFNFLPASCKQRHVFWYRFFLIRHWINTGFLKEGNVISHLDADVCIVNGSRSFEPSAGKSFAYAIDSCNTHCMGVFSLRITDWSKQMLSNLLSEDRWNKFKGNPFWQTFHDQASWYSLAGIKDTFADPDQPGWNTIEHLGWNSTKKNDPVYSLKELYENVEILPVEWGVTNWNQKNEYFRFPTKTNNRKDVIFRHFAGGSWHRDWAEVPIMFYES